MKLPNSLTQNTPTTTYRQKKNRHSNLLSDGKQSFAYLGQGGDLELTLAHKIRGVRGIYNHADMLDERVELMNWWADEVDKWRGVV